MKRSRVFLATFVRLSCILILLAGMLALPPARVLADTMFTVNTTADSPDPNHGNGTCGNGLVCSLRAAIEEASDLTIPFGTRIIINFSSSLPENLLTLVYGPIAWEGNYITVDGGTNNIIVSGSGMPGGSEAIFLITGHDNVLENLSIKDSPGHGVRIGSATAGNSTANSLQNLNIYNNYAGVFIQGAFVDNNEVSYNRIGNNGSSTICSPELDNGMDGIATYGSDIYGLIVRYNYIICNEWSGIYLGGTNHNAIIEGNFIGTDGVHTGLGNILYGIEAEGDFDTSIINNIISGNVKGGIGLEGSTRASIYSNRIGTAASGNAAIPNGEDGIIVTRLDLSIASANVIGSATDEAKRNTISGNGKCGVRLTGGSHDNVLNGNYIGLGADGTTIVPNGEAGVAIDDSDLNSISSFGETPVPQFISGNSREGVYIKNSIGNHINKRTFIGVAADFGTPRGNVLEGVKLDIGATNTEILSQKIVNNGGAGIALVNSTTITGNFLMPWFVGRNGGIPIDLGNDGFTENGTRTPPGPNNWQAYPILTGMTATGFSAQICPACRAYVYHAVNDPTRAQGGGGAPVELVPDGFGNFSYDIPADVVAVTMVTCDYSSFNCSEMSPKVLNPAWHFIYLPFIRR